MTEHSFLFETTAPYYARFRPGYPDGFFKHIVHRFELDGQGRLLDLGCGTGQLTLPLAPHFAEAVGMDPEEEMLQEAKKAAQDAALTNIRWLKGSSANLHPGVAPIRLVTMGRSFHWMDRDAVLATLFDIVETGGGVVIVTDQSAWPDERNYEAVTKKVVKKWLGEWRRAGSSYYAHPKDRHEVIIARSSFRSFETFRLRYERRWEVKQVIGHCFSTSCCSAKLLGENKQAFEDDLRTALTDLQPSGVFTEPVELEALLLFRG